MRVLDLFCGAGGASMGLHNGFLANVHITGVDISPQPRYPFHFIQADAMGVSLEGYDFIWASPPCQRYSPGAMKWGTQDNHPHLIPATRARLLKTMKPFIIENIPTAAEHLVNPIMLCGTQFGLGVFRHRLFETSFDALSPVHSIHTGRVGDGKYCTVTGHAGGSSTRDGWRNGGTAEWRVAMGIDWMTGNELAEAIPPAYAEYVVGEYLKSVGVGK